MSAEVQPDTRAQTAEPAGPDDPLDELLLGVGQRIRHYRRMRSLTLQSLASTTGLSASMLSTVERGQTGVSVATVHAIAQALDVSITALFQAAGPGDPVVKRAEQRQDFTTGGAARTLVIADPEMRLELYVYDFEPGTASANTPSVHSGMEYGISITGGLTVEINGREHVLESGDAVQYSTKQPHVMKNDGEETSRAVWLNISRM